MNVCKCTNQQRHLHFLVFLIKSIGEEFISSDVYSPATTIAEGMTG